nr:MAG TPA: hypothetical protein [Caudoviricetes sp.]
MLFTKKHQINKKKRRDLASTIISTYFCTK